MSLILDNPSLERLYTLDDVAIYLGVSVRTVRVWVREKRLRANRIGGQYRVAHSDLLALAGLERAQTV